MQLSSLSTQLTPQKNNKNKQTSKQKKKKPEQTNKKQQQNNKPKNQKPVQKTKQKILETEINLLPHLYCFTLPDGAISLMRIKLLRSPELYQTTNEKKKKQVTSTTNFTALIRSSHETSKCTGLTTCLIFSDSSSRELQNSLSWHPVEGSLPEWLLDQERVK